jgi:diacylglycerol kinase (ATP)
VIRVRALLILNPVAGRPKTDGWEERIQRGFHKNGIPCDMILTAKPGDALALARQAAEHRFDLVVAGGGDGTVNEVANGLIGSDTALGILPLGTVNVLARELLIPFRIPQAIRTIADGNRACIDVGCANGRHFTLMAGFGFDAEVVANVLQPMKDWIGSSAYILKGLEMLATYRATDVTLEMSEETYATKAFMVLVANASTYAYDLKIAPLAMPDDGLLDVCVFERPITDRIGFIGQVADVFMNRHIYHKAVRYFRTTRVLVRSNPEVQAQLDGDPFGATPIEITINPQCLPVIVPASPERI